tara:strand:- start:322 stop:636 length:315 start_codon:yes stop_codon:yes gene_type:complete
MKIEVTSLVYVLRILFQSMLIAALIVPVQTADIGPVFHQIAVRVDVVTNVTTSQQVMIVSVSLASVSEPIVLPKILLQIVSVKKLEYAHREILVVVMEPLTVVG